jgi:hypothetical protein
MARKTLKAVLFSVILAAVCSNGKAAATNDDTVQAQVILTVAESKRLIAMAVAQMPIVKDALRSGMVIITKGTTNTYVAEEILEKKIPHGAFLLGKVYPAKGGERLQPAESIGEIILSGGKHQHDLSLAEAAKKLKPGDVVIKGANALDYKNKTAGVVIYSSTAGTTGKVMPYVVARKAHLIIPVGLEKQIAGEAAEVANKMREPFEGLNKVPSMFLLTGRIVTEIEAFEILAGVTAFQAGAGGIGGAEGSVRLVVRGPRARVEKALKITAQIQGEPPFVE